MKKYLLILFPILICGCGSRVSQDVETCEVRKGKFTIDLTEEGELFATNAINLSAPAIDWRFDNLKITMIVDDGKEISTGDTVLAFDPSEVQKAIIDADAELEIAKAELEKLRAQHESKIEELKANVKISELSLKIAEIELEQATFEADIRKKEIQLNLEKSKIALDKASEEINNQRKIQNEEIQQSKLKIQQLETNLENANRSLKSLTVISPAPGIAIIRRNWRTGGKWQIGDQPWSGLPLIDLPDMNELQVNVKINEVDISKVSIGQDVEIRLDAFSDTVYNGKVKTVANLAQFKKRDSKIKVFPVEILLDGTSKKLLPGMTVNCRIIMDVIDNVAYVPLDAIFKEGTMDYVFVKSGKSFNKVQVKTGRRNNDYIILDKGVEAGETVAITDPFSENKLAENLSQ